MLHLLGDTGALWRICKLNSSVVVIKQTDLEMEQLTHEYRSDGYEKKKMERMCDAVFTVIFSSAFLSFACYFFKHSWT